MIIEELICEIDRIAWIEQVDQEMSERPHIKSFPSLPLINSQLSELAPSVDHALLDELEKEEGYLVWVLRLSQFVEPANAKQRALPYIDSPNWRIRYWARTIAHGE